nr:hypothetical protein [Streptomyces sp. Rer75]
MSTVMIPQVAMMRASQARAPKRRSSRLLGTSKKKYATKKIEAARPYAAALMPSSVPMPSWAKPMLVRSTYAMT